MATKIGRNDPCPCGSGRKYKHCCVGQGARARVPLSSAESELPGDPPTPRALASTAPEARPGGAPPEITALRGLPFGADPFDPIVERWARFRDGGTDLREHLILGLRRLATPEVRAEGVARLDRERLLDRSTREWAVEALVLDDARATVELLLEAFCAHLEEVRVERNRILAAERNALDPALAATVRAACVERKADAIAELARRLAAGLSPLPTLELLIDGGRLDDATLPLLEHTVAPSMRQAGALLSLRDRSASLAVSVVLNARLAQHEPWLGPHLVHRLSDATASSSRRLEDLERLVAVDATLALEPLVAELRRRPGDARQPIETARMPEVVRLLHGLGDAYTVGTLLAAEVQGELRPGAWSMFAATASKGPFRDEVAVLPKDLRRAVVDTNELSDPMETAIALDTVSSRGGAGTSTPVPGLRYHRVLDWMRPFEALSTPPDLPTWPGSTELVGQSFDETVAYFARPLSDGRLPLAMLHEWSGGHRRPYGAHRQRRLLADAYLCARGFVLDDATRAREIRAAILAIEPNHAFARRLELPPAPAVAVGPLPAVGDATGVPWHRRIRVERGDVVDLLRRNGSLDIRNGELDAAFELLPVVGMWNPMWNVGGVPVVAVSTPRGQQRDALRACIACARGPIAPHRHACRHELAAAIAGLWLEPRTRAALERTPWVAVLDAMSARAPAAPTRGGWVRYVLTTDAEVPVETWLVRAGSGGGAPKKPVLLKTLDKAIEADAATSFDRRVFNLLEDARFLIRQGGTRADPAYELDRIGVGLLADAVRALAGAADVWYDGRPVRVRAEPVRPVLVAEPEPDGGVALRFEPRVVEVLDLGERYGLLDDDTVARLEASLAVVRGLRGTTIVPPADVPQLLDRLARPDALAVELRGFGERVAPVGQLVLDIADTEAELSLSITVRAAYRAPGRAERLATPGDGGRLLTSKRFDGTTSLVVRDLDAEAAFVARVVAVAGSTLPLRLTGDDAYAFLDMGLPALRADLEVLADEALLRRLRGSLTASLWEESGIDWFDLRVRFACDGIEADGAAVLDAWRRKRRYLRLADGTIARLPVDWLAKHGWAAEEIAALRGADGRLPSFAAGLAASLYDDVPTVRPAWLDAGRRLAGFDGIPEREVPSGFTAQLRRYQHRGFEWLVFLRDGGLGGVLADDMGLGKTVQALALLADTHRESGPPSLVVAPTSVVHNWAREAGRFAPGLRVCVHHGARRDPRALDTADLVVTSYALLRLDSAIATHTWRIAILDEAQTIKNPASHVARAARALRARHRFALSGTPLENHLHELWSLFEYLLPGFFGTRAAFTRAHGSGSLEAFEALRRRIRPFVLRRLKAEVAPELPPLTTVVLHCELGHTQRHVYETLREAYRQSVEASVRAKGVARSKLLILEALLRLRQACCDPRLLPDSLRGDCAESAKLVLLFEVLDAAIDEGHRTLVFSQWTSLLRHVADELDHRGIAYLYLDGATRERAELVRRWNSPDGPPLFLISLKAGGTGLNLTGADHVVHLDPWWNPASEAQATDRAHRIGQARPVVAYKLVARGTVEEKVLELQAKKRHLFTAAIDTGRLDLSGLTLEDLEACFGGELPVADEPEAGASEPGDVPARGEPREGGVRAEPVTRRRRKPALPADTAQSLPAQIDRVLAGREFLTNADVRATLGLDPDGARRWLARAVAAGLLVQTGARRGTRYQPPPARTPT